MSRKTKYYVGQIVRRNTSSGPIGPYMVVEHIEDDRIYTGVIGLDTPNEMLLKSNIHTVSITSLAISEHQLEMLRKGRMTNIQHPATKAWQRVFDDPPELITFYTTTKGYSSVFKIDRVSKTFYGRETLIRITIREHIL